MACRGADSVVTPRIMDTLGYLNVGLAIVVHGCLSVNPFGQVVGININFAGALFDQTNDLVGRNR
jgi:hypothetical protein